MKAGRREEGLVASLPEFHGKHLRPAGALWSLLLRAHYPYSGGSATYLALLN